MDADYSVELGADDDVLEFPWSATEQNLRYYNLKNQPDLLLYISEAADYPELGRFLAALNSPTSVLLTAKCDVWTDDALSEADAIYDAQTKLSSYIDHLFEAPSSGNSDPRFSFESHERFAQRLVQLLSRVPPIPAAVEAIVRRCYYHLGAGGDRTGFYLTIYVSGYGEDPADARRRWSIVLDLLKNVLLQLSAEVRRNAL